MSNGIILLKEFYIPLLSSIGLYLLIWVVKNVGIVKLRKISKSTDTFIDDLILNVLSVTKNSFIFAVSALFGFYLSPWNKDYSHIANKFFVIIISIQALIWSKAAIIDWVKFTVEKKNNDPSVRTTMNFIGLILRFSTNIGIILFSLNNLGVNVSTFIAGLGVGGVAIALATQNILGDLFSSLSIVLDRPFVVGDFITVGDWMGTVEHVGLKTTRVRSLSGEEIVVSNTNLLSSKINNFKRMKERRVVFKIGITYSTKKEHLLLAPKLIEKIIKDQQLARFDRSHLLNFADFSLEIETAYYVLSPEFIDYANIHQKILVGIFAEFEANGIEFAFPTQTLYLEKVPEKIS